MAKKDIKYKPEYADQLPAMFEQGEDVIEVAVALGVCRATFYNWLEKYPDFAAAYEIGKGISEAWWRKLGRAGACGKADVNPSIWIFNMKAKFGMKETTVLEMPDGITVNSKVEYVDPRDKKDE